MFVVMTWLWGEAYSGDDVRRLAAGVARNLARRHRFICVTDNPARLQGLDIETIEIPQEDRPLLAIKGCFARLRMFSRAWQRANGIDEQFANVDLDTVVTANLDGLFCRDEPFVILQGGNAVNPCPYNGALMLLRAGYRPDVWDEFSPAAAARTPHYRFPDDQGWLAAKLPNAAEWRAGAESGVYVYQKPGWPGGKTTTALPEGARLVTFINGHPRDLAQLDWVKRHWR